CFVHGFFTCLHELCPVENSQQGIHGSVIDFPSKKLSQHVINKLAQAKKSTFSQFYPLADF
ncbi:MAG TPA: hypothetical protein PKW33_20395, partial [Anaerolineaceae bacterium]|nr:hypothetical protein [Anaerolineaceae bacterium]HPN53967.1 hypothetical protein [Anaerolineaceae bacterium]